MMSRHRHRTDNNGIDAVTLQNLHGLFRGI